MSKIASLQRALNLNFLFKELHNVFACTSELRFCICFFLNKKFGINRGALGDLKSVGGLNPQKASGDV